MTADMDDAQGPPSHGGRTGCAGWALRRLEISLSENVLPQLRI